MIAYGCIGHVGRATSEAFTLAQCITDPASDERCSELVDALNNGPHGTGDKPGGDDG